MTSLLMQEEETKAPEQETGTEGMGTETPETETEGAEQTTPEGTEEGSAEGGAQ